MDIRLGPENASEYIVFLVNLGHIRILEIAIDKCKDEIPSSFFML